jgi:hypothetical protein
MAQTLRVGEKLIAIDVIAIIVRIQEMPEMLGTNVRQG